MGSPSPASPVTKTTQVSEMDPRLYQWMYGTPNSPGRLQIANAAKMGRLMQGVQDANPTALAAYYNVPKGTDLSQFQSHTGAMNPGQVDPGLAKFPGQSITPTDYYKEATAGDKKGKKDPTSTAMAAQGGTLEGYARGGKPRPGYDEQGNLTEAGYNFIQNKIEKGKPVSAANRRAIAAYDKAHPKTVAGNTGDTPLSKADADIGVTPFYDPTTMQSTNPYYNKAIDVLNKMGQMPSQYQQASDIYSQAAQGLQGLANYTPQQVAAANINRGDIRDVSAQQAQVERMQGGPNVNAVMSQADQMTGPGSWTDPGVAQKYMSPYMQNVVDIQKREANRDYQKQMAQLSGQAAGMGAFGGSRSAMERAELRRNQAQKLADIQAMGQQAAYSSGMGQYGAESQLGQAAKQSNLGASMQSILANQQAGMTAQQLNQMYGQGGFQAQAANQQAQNQAYNNYVQQQLTAAGMNQGMDWNTANQNAQMQMQAQIANQQAGLQANQQNIGAYSAMGNMGQGMLGVGQGMGAYNQNLLQNWGSAGNTLQNLAQGYYDRRQQSAQNIFGGVNQATQPAAGTLTGSPWGSNYQGTYQQRKKGGKLSIKV